MLHTSVLPTVGHLTSRFLLPGTVSSKNSKMINRSPERHKLCVCRESCNLPWNIFSQLQIQIYVNTHTRQFYQVLSFIPVRTSQWVSCVGTCFFSKPSARPEKSSRPEGQGAARGGHLHPSGRAAVNGLPLGLCQWASVISISAHCLRKQWQQTKH